MDDALSLIVRIFNMNSRIAIGRDSETVAAMRDLLVEKGLIERVNLYDCKVCDDFTG